MLHISHIEELQGTTRPIHWAMGVFDGIHLGHQAVIASAKKARASQGGLVAVLSFKKHPLTLLNPKGAPSHILADEEEKCRLLAEMGVDILLNITFDQAFAALSANTFLDMLATQAPIASISVGEDWRFGAQRQGDAAFLIQEGMVRGFSVSIVPPVTCRGERISSTSIRQHIAKGNFEAAAEMLGRPYMMTGHVIHGKQLARTLGFPTANIRVANEQTPPYGVYAVLVHTPQGVFPGVANLGLRPTIHCDNHELLLEAHLFNYTNSLYGQTLQVECIRMLRPERTFPSLDALQTQIQADAAQARQILEECRSTCRN